ncbi:hypothetical protein RIF29_15213 [Crotalaria pallida]|uniref:Uncharacterized protein n=1 Tax=Crotalaria pallida TaxID=3830 RepID=A0AAN9IJ01_CROPI
MDCLNDKSSWLQFLFSKLSILAAFGQQRGLEAFKETRVSNGESEFSNIEFLLNAIYSSLDVYLMAVLSLGIMVSIAKDRFGWDAIWVVSGLTKGRCFCGWVLSRLLVGSVEGDRVEGGGVVIKGG